MTSVGHIAPALHCVHNRLTLGHGVALPLSPCVHVLHFCRSTSPSASASSDLQHFVSHWGLTSSGASPERITAAAVVAGQCYPVCAHGFDVVGLPPTPLLRFGAMAASGALERLFASIGHVVPCNSHSNREPRSNSIS